MENKPNIQKVREYWDSILPDKKPYITAKLYYNSKRSSIKERVVRIFKSELSKGDVYLELYDSNGDFVGENHGIRTLYHIPYNAGYDSMYAKEASDIYLLTMSQLDKHADGVSKREEKEAPPVKVSSEPMLSTDDANISELTIKDLAAILLKTPVSDKQFLNEVINKCR